MFEEFHFSQSQIREFNILHKCMIINNNEQKNHLHLGSIVIESMSICNMISQSCFFTIKKKVQRFWLPSSTFPRYSSK